MNGEKIGHYEVRKEIGRGGMGAVYLASDPKLNRDVALKILPTFMAKDGERIARFQREAEILAGLNHPNIAAIYGLEDNDGSHALVLELIEGPTLAERIAQGPVPIDETLSITRQIAEGVEAAHEKGIVHRDLKPSNVKITPEGRVKVLDFGLAKAVQGDRSEGSQPDLSLSPTITGGMTGANVILGTAAYMSPEQARGAAVDRRADIWAFGVILFEMLTGKLLFGGPTVSDTLAGVLKTEPDWNALPENTPPRIRRLLRRCLNRDPRRRLRDMGDARLAIEEELAGTPDETPAVTAATTETPAPARSPWITVAAVVAVAAITAAAVWFLTPSGTEPPLRKFTVPLESIGSVDPALSPDGTQLAYTSEGKLWIRDMSRFEARPIEGTEGARHPFWSPDGEWVGFGTADAIRKVPRGGGDPVPVAALAGGEQRFNSSSGAAWGPGGRIVFCSGSGGLFEVSAQGGDPRQMHEPEDSVLDYHNLAALPDGRGWVFVVHRKQGGYDTIGILSADGVRNDILTHESLNINDPFYSATGHILYHRTPTAAGIWALPFSLDEMAPTGEPFLVAANATEPAAAADGTLVFMQGSGVREYQLVQTSRDGKVEAALGEPAAFWPFPSLSPDDSKVVIRIGEGDNRNLWSHDVTRGTRSRLTFFTNRTDFASWSDDGSLIYSYKFGGEEEMMMYVMNADGTGEPRDIARGILPVPVPGGRHLIYTSDDPSRSDWDISYLELGPDGIEEEPEAVPFINSAASEWWPRPSPDGRHILYVSDESGRDEVYLSTFPEPSGKWQVSIDGGNWPLWRADGAEIYFVVDDRMMVVEADTGSGVRLGRPQELFRRPPSGSTLPWPDGFDVTADGNKFVFVQAAETEDDTGAALAGIAVVQNWFREFEGRF
jgi:serine/threonine-protein kinase